MTSRHGSGTGGRRVAPWIIATAVAVVVVVGLATAFILITRDDKDQATCTSQVVLQVVVAPAAAPSIEAAAAAFDATAPVARSACVSTDVTTMAGPEAAAALAQGWVAQPSQAPALWFPDSAADLTTLESTDSAMTAGRNVAPMASSPVVLAMSAANAAAVSAAALQWTDLPTAAGAAGSLALPDGSRLILALPDPTTNRATSEALQSVVAEPTGTTVDPAAVTANAAALAAVAAGGPAVQPSTTSDALDDLIAGGAGFAAVPVIASDFDQMQGQSQGLATVSPGGATSGDQIFAVPVTASWVDPTASAAASAFLAYLRGPAGTQAFTDHGLQVGSPSPVQLPDAGSAVATALAGAIGSPGAAGPSPTPTETAAPTEGAAPSQTAAPGGSGTSAPTS